jgi:hypothetical protein
VRLAEDVDVEVLAVTGAQVDAECAVSGAHRNPYREQPVRAQRAIEMGH